MTWPLGGFGVPRPDHRVGDRNRLVQNDFSEPVLKTMRVDSALARWQHHTFKRREMLRLVDMAWVGGEPRKKHRVTSHHIQLATFTIPTFNMR